MTVVLGGRPLRTIRTASSLYLFDEERRRFCRTPIDDAHDFRPDWHFSWSSYEAVVPHGMGLLITGIGDLPPTQRSIITSRVVSDSADPKGSA